MVLSGVRVNLGEYVARLNVAVSLQTALSDVETTDYREEGKIILVTLRSVAEDRQGIGKLESLNIFSQLTGSAVPLKRVADIDITRELPSICAAIAWRR